MRKTILAAAVAALLSVGAPANNAAAMPAVTPSELALSRANTGLVQKTAFACGPWGCVRFGPRYWGWRRPWIGPPPAYWGWRRPWIGPWGWHRSWGWRHHWRRW